MACSYFVGIGCRFAENALDNVRRFCLTSFKSQLRRYYGYNRRNQDMQHIQNEEPYART